MNLKELRELKCIPCPKGTSPLSKGKERERFAPLAGWQLTVPRGGAVLLFLCLLTAASDPIGSAPTTTCRPQQQSLIDAETHCTPAGIDIDYFHEHGIKVACLEDARVQRLCGLDGELTREKAFDLWQSRLQIFMSSCDNEGGVVAYDQPDFVEPTSSSYCLQAQPEVVVGAFEAQRCNFRSLCPAIIVSCQFFCFLGPNAVQETPPQTLADLLASLPGRDQ